MIPELDPAVTPSARCLFRRQVKQLKQAAFECLFAQIPTAPHRLHCSFIDFPPVIRRTGLQPPDIRPTTPSIPRQIKTCACPQVIEAQSIVATETRQMT